MSKKNMIRLPGFKGVAGGPPGRLIAGTALREIARAISELDGAHVSAKKLEPEIKAIETLLRQRAALTHGPVNDDLCRFGATLVLEAMLQLARLTDGGAL